MPHSPPLRIAFIGAGTMAGHHLRALRRVATSHTVVGVHDVKGDAAEALARLAGTRAYPSVAALLAEARPDLVHICTPAGMHFQPARQALLAGAHVYVEKPFVEALEEAEILFALARERGRSICAGHQLVRDPAFGTVMRGSLDLHPVTLVDSNFAFRPPRLDPYQSTERALGAQLLDVLPHPLYTLVAGLEGVAPGASVKVAHVTATPTALHALLRAGAVTGRLSISLRVRPVASTLTIAGARGSLTADFVRGIVVGAANEGTSPIEKIVNPLLEAAQLAWRSAASLVRRLLRGTDYPGLAELLGDFYAAAAAGQHSPVSIEHLRRVTAVYEQIAICVRNAVPAAVLATPVAPETHGRVAVLTGAGGFFGRAISRELARRGFRVRGIGRSDRPDDPHLREWVRADLADEIPSSAFAGADVIVHAAAETAGGFDAHERNTVGATRRVLRAMAAAGVRQLVYVSSISVLRPPHTFWEQQTERTPRAARPDELGPYTWGKCAAEELVAAAHEGGDVEARIIRPAALIDWDRIEVPGLLGRRLFGRWHLGLGRPGLPLAVCDVGRAGAAVGWCADRFADAPPVVNLMDPAIRTRGQLLAAFRRLGWHGRMMWVPISVLAGGVMLARFVIALLHGERAQPMDVWSILRPRRYDAALATTLLAAAGEDAPPAEPALRTRAAAQVSGAHA